MIVVTDGASCVGECGAPSGAIPERPCGAVAKPESGTFLGKSAIPDDPRHAILIGPANRVTQVYPCHPDESITYDLRVRWTPQKRSPLGSGDLLNHTTHCNSHRGLR